MATEPVASEQGRESLTGADAVKESDAEVRAPQLNMGDPHFLTTALSTYAELRETGAVVRVTVPESKGKTADKNTTRRAAIRGFFGRDVYFVARHAEAAEAVRDERLACNPLALKTPEERASMPQPPEELRPFLYSLMVSDPPDHTRLRKLVQPWFNAPVMEALRPKIQRLADGLLDQAEGAAAARGEKSPQRHMELLQAFAYPLPITVMSELVGIPAQDHAQVQHWTEMLAQNRGSSGFDAELRENMLQLIAYLRALFAAKRRQPEADLISQLLHAQEDGDKLSDDELLSMVVMIYMAGHVTTVQLIGNGVFALLTHPQQLAHLLANLDRARDVVEETLRYWGPVDNIVGRIATQDLELGGTHIPKGERVMIGLASAGRDPLRFANPDEFDITRPDASRHLAFGRGIHLCLGAPLARIVGQVAFTTLFRRYPNLQLAVPATEVRWGKTALRGFEQIPVLF